MSLPTGTIAAAHQSHFLPWLRYIEKALRCDVFLVLDDVQFVKGDWHNRNKLKGPQGWFYLTVPVKHRLGQRLDEVEIDNRQHWRRRHLQSLRSSYGRTPYFKQIFPRLEEVYMSTSWQSLCEFNQALLDLVFELMQVHCRTLLSSSLNVTSSGTQRLSSLCLSVEATVYLSGAYAAAQYLDADALASSGITTIYQLWQAPRYEQAHPNVGFVGDLSIIDLLMSHGPATKDTLLMAGGASRSLPVTS